MTAVANRSRTALLVIDVQNGVVGNTYQRDRVVANIQTLVGKARAEDVPVLCSTPMMSCRKIPRLGSTFPNSSAGHRACGPHVLWGLVRGANHKRFD